MKYQIYLNKETTEVINTIAKASNTKPSTFIKDFIEECFNFTKKTLGTDKIEEVKAYGKANTKQGQE